MNLALLFNPWFWLGAVAAATGIWLHGYNSNTDADKVRAEWVAAEQAAQRERAERIEEVRVAQAVLQRETELERRRFDEKQNAARAELLAELDGLRNRAKRGDRQQALATASAPGPAAEAGKCTGAELYQDDAMFLARFAASAQGIREQRDLCYSQYEAAQRRLRELGDGSGEAK